MAPSAAVPCVDHSCSGSQCVSKVGKPHAGDVDGLAGVEALQVWYHQARHVPRQWLQHARTRMCLGNTTSYCIAMHQLVQSQCLSSEACSSRAARLTQQSAGTSQMYLVVVLVGALAPQGGMMPPELVSRDRGAVRGVPEWVFLRVVTGTSEHVLDVITAVSTAKWHYSSRRAVDNNQKQLFP